MGVIPNPKMPFIFPISWILALSFPIFIKYFPKYEGKGSFPKSQIKSLIHRTNCMQRIKKILMWEVLPATALKLVGLSNVNQMRNRSNHKLNCVDDSRHIFNLRTFKREHLISYKMFDSLVAEILNMKHAFDPVL